MGTIKTEPAQTPDQKRAKLHEIVDGTRTVVLLSHGEDGKIVGRPMALVRTDADSTVYLVTGIETKKVDEVFRDPRVTVSVQARDGFAMIDGEVRVSQDRALIDELWSDSWKAWFSGKDDPSIAILVITPNEGTYWDQDLGSGLSFLYRMVKARVTGTEIERKPGDQATVDLRKH